MRLTGIFVLIFFIYLYNVISVDSLEKSDLHQKNSIFEPDGFPQKRTSNCCLKRVITQPPEFAGNYFFNREFETVKNPNCIDGCIYNKEGEPGNEYCFKPVSSNAATFEDQCEILTTENPGPTSSSPAESTTESSETTASNSEVSEPPDLVHSSPISFGQLQECLERPMGLKIVPPGGTEKNFPVAYKIDPPKGKKQLPSQKVYITIPVKKENANAPFGNMNAFPRGDIIEPPTKSNCSKEKSTESKPFNERKIQPPQGTVVIPPSGFIISPPIGK